MSDNARILISNCTEYTYFWPPFRSPGDAAAAVGPRVRQGAHLLADADLTERPGGAAGREINHFLSNIFYT